MENARDGKPVVARLLGAEGGTEIRGVRWAIEPNNFSMHRSAVEAM
jgi:hypothetical protein